MTSREEPCAEVADGFAGAERAVVEAQRLNGLGDPERPGTVRGTERRAEPAPTELPFVTAVAEDAIDEEGDDLRPAVHGDDDMLGFAGKNGAGVALPTRFLTTVVERQAERAGCGGRNQDASAGAVATVEQGLAGNERVEREPDIEAEARA